MKKIIMAIVLLVAIFATFWQTMNNLHITVNTEENGAMVECFGQVWYHDVEII